MVDTDITHLIREGHSALEPHQDEAGEFNYFALNAADRLKAVKEKIEEREKVYFELEMAQASLAGNPEPGEHQEEPRPGIPCQCGICELARVNRMLRSNRFAIEQLRALFARLQ